MRADRVASSAWFGLALILVLVVGVLDYGTGPEISVTVFYLLPIFLASWKLGLASGILFTALSSLTWFVADWVWEAPYSNPWIPYWNVLMRFGVFASGVVLIDRTKRLHESLRQKALSLAEEVAERTRAEQALAESQKTFRLITENASDLIAMLGGNGECLYLSPSYESGPSAALAQPGQEYFRIVAEEDRPQVRAAFFEALQSRMSRRVEYRIRSRQRAWRYFESEWSAIRESAEEAAKVVVVSRDITVRKRMELLLANEREILEAIAQGKPMAGVLGKIVQKVGSWSEQIYCSVLVLNPAGDATLHLASPGLETSSAVASQEGGQIENHPESVGASRTEPESLARSEWARYRQTAENCGLEIVYSKSLVSALHEVLGVLTVFSRGEQDSETVRLHVFDRIAQVTAIALERQRSEETLRRLSTLLLETQEAERRRVARELHDGVNQLLSSVAFRVESIIEALAADHSSLQREVTKVRWLLQRAIREVRSISENLRPSELDELGLVAALRDLCKDFQERGSMTVQLEAPGRVQRFAGEVELSLYRIVQEALTNAAKHSGASAVALRLNWDEASITLQVQDNGTGLRAGVPETETARSRRGMGLIDMRERCMALGGSFSVHSQPGRGTEIAVSVPRENGRLASGESGKFDGKQRQD